MRLYTQQFFLHTKDPSDFYPLWFASYKTASGNLRWSFAQVAKRRKKSKGTESDVKISSPNPRVKLPYIYLMVWYIMYFPSLTISPSEDISVGMFIQRHEGCDWRNYFMCTIRKTVCIHQNYYNYRYFPNFSRGAYGEEFKDTTSPDGYPTFLPAVFGG